VCGCEERPELISDRATLNDGLPEKALGQPGANIEATQMPPIQATQLSD